MKELIDELRGEHAVILSKVDALERTIASGETPDVGEYVEFFRTYVEERHHAKEEGTLFPRMRENQFLSGVVDALLDEHDEARRIVEELGSGGGDPVTLLSSYAQNLRWHIAKEDTMIFEAAQHALS